MTDLEAGYEPVRNPQTHDVKCWPEFFRHVIDGSKTFEVRKDDRGYQEGDRLILREYDATTDTFTGRRATATIGYVLRDHCAAIPDFGGHVVFSLHEVRDAAADQRSQTCEQKPDLCLREVVVTSDTACDPAWLAATHVFCMRPLPCNNPHHKPDSGWASV